jgi:hypothetical protein
MAMDWDIYSEKILEQIESKKSSLFEDLLYPIKVFIDENVYWALEDMIPVIDFLRDDFTLRLSWDGSVDKKDDRNILFSLKEEISGYDSGDFERLDRLKVMFQKGSLEIEARIQELEKEWGRE